MAEEQYTRQFHVTIEHVPWKGDSPVTAGEAITQFTQAIYVNGTLLTFRDWMDDHDDLEVEAGADIRMRGFMDIRIRHLDDAAFDALDVGDAEWMEDDDTREDFGLPVASLLTRAVPVMHARSTQSF